MRWRRRQALLGRGDARENDQKKDRAQIMRWREMSFHELYRYFLTVPILRVCPVDSECSPRFRVRDLSPVAKVLRCVSDLQAGKENGCTARGDRPNSPIPAIQICAFSNLCDDFSDEQKYKACAQGKQPDQSGE
jgi:hypothetical protein